MRIAVAVTTAPRAKSYLDGTLKSLFDAGFDVDLISVDKGKCIVPNDIPVFHSDTQLGSYRNFLAALDLLLTIDAEAVAVFEDDIRVARGLREWLETALWPDDPDEIGVISLYTPSQNQPSFSGWFLYDLTPNPDYPAPYRSCSGACAFLMPVESAARLVQDNPREINHRDYAVAKWCQDTGLGFIAHAPSLVEHVGRVSAIHGEKLSASRDAGRFVEDVSKLCVGRSAELEATVPHSENR